VEFVEDPLGNKIKEEIEKEEKLKGKGGSGV